MRTAKSTAPELPPGIGPVKSASLHLYSSLPLSAIAAGIPLAPVEPTVPVRTRYFVVTSAQPVDVRVSHPVAAMPIDLSDPPPVLKGELARTPPLAGWRFESVLPKDLLLHARVWPPLEAGTGPQPQRVTRTSIGADGSVLHRDRYSLAGGRTAFEFTVPPPLELESVEVEGKTVRPVERDGRFIVSLPFTRLENVVEVVTAERVRLPAGRRRERWKATLVDPGGSFLVHTWELRLASSHALKLMAGDLKAVPVAPAPTFAETRARRDTDEARVAATGPTQVPTARDPWAILQQAPGVLVDRVNVGGTESGQQSNFISPGGGIAMPPPELATPPTLLLTGALVPSRVAIELEIAPARR